MFHFLNANQITICHTAQFATIAMQRFRNFVTFALVSVPKIYRIVPKNCERFFFNFSGENGR
jgi:hypothetical protein